jgi:hypothetical protein
VCPTHSSNSKEKGEKPASVFPHRCVILDGKERKMKRFVLTVIAGLAIGAVSSAARAADDSRYSSRASLIAFPQEVTIAALPGRTAGAVEPTAVDVSYYSTRAALLGRGLAATIAALPSKSAAELAPGPAAVSAEGLNTKRGLIK